MEGDAEARGMRPGGAQQRRRGVRRRAEFAGEVMPRHALAQREADDEAAIAGGAGGGLRQDLRQFFRRIQREVAHAMRRPGRADGAAGLDRVHEVDAGRGEQAAHQRHLGQGGAVEMPHPAGPQRAERQRVRVALHGIKRAAGEAFDEFLRGGADHRGAQAIERRFRALGRDQGGDVRQGGRGEGGGRADEGHRNLRMGQRVRGQRSARPMAAQSAKESERISGSAVPHSSGMARAATRRRDETTDMGGHPHDIAPPRGGDGQGQG